MRSRPDTPQRQMILSVDAVTKDFLDLRALDEVSLRVHRGEIVALLGQNGSGKSTLVKVMAGVYTADSGTVRLGDTALHVLHQDLGLVGGLSTVENLDIGRRNGRSLSPLRRKAENARVRAALRRFGMDIDVQLPVSRLTPAQRSIVAIARAMDGWSTPDNVLVLDEPTAALHGDEVATLLTAVVHAAASGAGIIFISHRLDEVTQLADRVVVLRDGRKVADAPSSGLTADRLAEMITGCRTGPTGTAALPLSSSGVPALMVRGLGGGALRRLDLQLWPGEVLGVAGNLGSGREHVAGLIFGSTKRAGGTIAVSGSILQHGTPHEALRNGLALVPADRAAHGGVPSLSVRENLTLPQLRPLSFARVHLRRRHERADADRWTRLVGLHPALPDRPLGQFSGGNQQKAVMARWLRTTPTVLLVEEPTQGVDVGASEAIRELIAEAARGGTAVLVASSDNADLVRLCSRVLVLRDGEPVAQLSGEEITDHRLTQESLGLSAAELIAAAHLESNDV